MFKITLLIAYSVIAALNFHLSESTTPTCFPTFAQRPKDSKPKLTTAIDSLAIDELKILSQFFKNWEHRVEEFKKYGEEIEEKIQESEHPSQAQEPETSEPTEPSE